MVWAGAQATIARSPNLSIFMEFMASQISQVRDPGGFLDQIAGQGFLIQEIAHDGTLMTADRDRLLSQTWGELLLTRNA